jgi:hypothetical protein
MPEWLVPIVSVISAVIVAYFTALFTSRSKRDEGIVRFKEEKYAKLLIKLQGFVGTTASADLKREFFEEQYQSWLYASDNVVLALNALVNLVIDARGSEPDPQAGRRAVGNVVFAMRSDLLGRTSLNHSAFRYTDVGADRM